MFNRQNHVLEILEGRTQRFLVDKRGNEIKDRFGKRISTLPKIVDKQAIGVKIQQKFKTSNTLSCQPQQVDPKFQGWWRLKTTWGALGMNGNSINGIPATQTRNDSFIYIDTTVYPVQVFSTYFNDKYPQFGPDFFNGPPDDVFPTEGATNALQYITFDNNPRKLVSPFNPPLTDPVSPDLSQLLQYYSAGPTILLYKDDELHVNLFLNFKYNQYNNVINPAIFEKIATPPIDTTFLDWNDPLNLFLFYVADMKYQNTTINKNTKAINYIGKEAEDDFLQQIQSPNGLTITAPLRAMRITNTLNYPDALISNDTWTTLYTGCPKKNKGKFFPICPGTSPIISGATGQLAILNGIYPNGVGVFNNGGDATLESRFVDIGKNGSLNNHINSFLLNLDTTSLNTIADQNGFVQLPTGITVTVTYKINSNSEYPELIAAIRAYYYLVIRTTTHGSINAYHPKNTAKLYDTFAALRADLAIGNTSQNPKDYGIRRGYAPLNEYYHNWFDFGYVSGNLINIPYPLTFNNPILEYDVAIGNYLVNIQNLYFAIQGTVQSNQLDPSYYGYLPALPGPGRAGFVTKLLRADVQTAPGLITPNGSFGDIVPTGYQTMGSYGDDFSNLNSYFIAQVNPNLTGGKIIGYFKLSDCLFMDPALLMFEAIYTSENPNTSNNPRIFREALCASYAPIFQWFNEIGCESIIIDWVYNQGGSNYVPLTISEFLGSDRLFINEYSVSKGENTPIYSSKDKETKVVNNTFKGVLKSQYGYVSLNEKLYPGSVFKGCKHNKKYVTLITDYTSKSSGDNGPNYFTGKNDDGDLGCDTYCRILGSIDGREYAADASMITPPYNQNPVYDSNNFMDQSGNPAVPFFYSRDVGFSLVGYTEKQISSSRQHNGIIPLPCPIKGTSKKYNNSMPFSVETLLFPDFGLNPPIRPPIPGWTSTHTYPPNFNDPSTWQFTYLDGAILTLAEPEKYFFSKEYEKLKRDDSDLSLKPKC